MVQLGVFLIPPAAHPFYALCTGVLGYDIWTRYRSPSSLASHLGEETATRWLGEAPTFGLHCTIVAAWLLFDDADLGEIEDRLAWIAGRTAPFRLVDGHFLDDFRANPRVLLTDFDDPDRAVHRLHRQVATIISPLHVGSLYAPWVPALGEREREIYGRTGEPWALELFTPHWSLLTGLPDQSAWETARNVITTRLGLFADDRTCTLDISDVHLVRREEDGYFSVAASFPLTGS